MSALPRPWTEAPERVGLPQRTRRELAYPEAWLRGWVSVLGAAPRLDMEPMPRVDIIAIEPAVRGVAGRFYPDDYKIVVYAGADRADALATLIHELAHAWAPYERAHHGRRWRETYVGLFAWLTGCHLDLEGLPAFVRAGVVNRDGSRSRVCDDSMRFVLDREVEHHLLEMAPRINLWTDADTGARPVIVANIGGRIHKHEVPHGTAA